jgi:VanZ family protein
MKRLLRFLPAVLWMSLIFFFSSRPTDGVAVFGPWRFLFFKSLHLIEYIVLFLLFCYGYQRSFASVVSAFLFALTDEFHQSFTPTRGAKFSDALIDLLGIFLGYLLLSCFHRRLKHLTPLSE